MEKHHAAMDIRLNHGGHSFVVVARSVFGLHFRYGQRRSHLSRPAGGMAQPRRGLAAVSAFSRGKTLGTTMGFPVVTSKNGEGRCSPRTHPSNMTRIARTISDSGALGWASGGTPPGANLPCTKARGGPSTSSRVCPSPTWSMKVCTMPTNGTFGDATVLATGTLQQPEYQRIKPLSESRRHRSSLVPAVIRRCAGVV